MDSREQRSWGRKDRFAFLGRGSNHQGTYFTVKSMLQRVSGDQLPQETHTQERSWSLSKWHASLAISLWIQSTEQKHLPLNLPRLWKRKGTKRRWVIGLIQSHSLSLATNPLQKLQVALTWTSYLFSLGTKTRVQPHSTLVNLSVLINNESQDK